MEGSGLMRPYCMHCTIKHLGQAYAHHAEIHTGYPKHILGVVGHLAEAAEECIGISPELANDIRGYRLLILNSVVDIYVDKKDVDIPYFDLFHKAVMIIKEKGCGSCQSSTDKLKSLIAKKES